MTVPRLFLWLYLCVCLPVHLRLLWPLFHFLYSLCTRVTLSSFPPSLVCVRNTRHEHTQHMHSSWPAPVQPRLTGVCRYCTAAAHAVWSVIFAPRPAAAAAQSAGLPRLHSPRCNQWSPQPPPGCRAGSWCMLHPCGRAGTQGKTRSMGALPELPWGVRWRQTISAKPRSCCCLT